MLPTRVRRAGRQAPLPDAVAIRRVAVPDGAPPYDDDLRASRLKLSGTANHPIPAPLPGRPGDLIKPDSPSRPDMRGRPDRPGMPASQSRPGSQASQHAHGTASPPARTDPWPSQFAQVLAETLSGSRPAHQLTPWTTEQARRRIRQLGPLLATDQRPRVRRVLTSAPANDVLELTAVVGFGPRVRALALRLERAESHSDGRTGSRWCCTAIESA